MGGKNINNRRADLFRKCLNQYYMVDLGFKGGQSLELIRDSETDKA